MVKDCVDCRCERIEPSYDACSKLQDANDEQVLCAINTIQTTDDYTTLPKKMAKVLYQFWCIQKNIILQICWLLGELKRLCQTLACLNKRIDDLQQAIIERMIDNVAFNMSSRTAGGGTSTGGATYMKSSVDPKNKTFSFTWNMVFSGVEIGVGTISGKVDSDYKPNQDGTVTVNIKSYTITNITYRAKRGGSSSANISIFKIDGNALVNHTYNPYSSWDLTVNRTVSVGKVMTLQPKSATGDIELFTIRDTWQVDPTNGVAFASYMNNNDKLPDFTSGCAVDCPN